MKRGVGPRISEQSAEFYPGWFLNANRGHEYALEAYPVLYKKTLLDLKGQFTALELSLIVTVHKDQAIDPAVLGIMTRVEDGIELSHLDETWGIDGNLLMGKLSVLTIFQASCLEVWASAFWATKQTDMEKWVKQLV